MAAKRKSKKGTPGRSVAPRADAACPQVGETQEHRESTKPEPGEGAPTVGKSGGRGARAERPYEGGNDRKQAKKPLVESTRAHKPPAETPKASDLSGAEALGGPAK